MKQEAISSRLATPNDLQEEGRLFIFDQINPLIADAFALYVKTKNFHWHMSGKHFRDYHLLLDEQSEQIFAMIDPLAERIRKLGGSTIKSISHIASLQHVPDDNEPYLDAHQMLCQLAKDNEEYAARMRSAHEVCEKYKDIATASLLENFIDETERRTWFLFEATN
ncbi:MAG: Dps family protein [Parachlamydiaceae bacterium]